jgi:hypothetical protein
MNVRHVGVGARVLSRDPQRQRDCGSVGPHHHRQPVEPAAAVRPRRCATAGQCSPTVASVRHPQRLMVGLSGNPLRARLTATGRMPANMADGSHLTLATSAVRGVGMPRCGGVRRCNSLGARRGSRDACRSDPTQRQHHARHGDEGTAVVTRGQRGGWHRDTPIWLGEDWLSLVRSADRKRPDESDRVTPLVSTSGMTDL